MSMNIDEIIAQEAVRRREFPVAACGIFMAHAGVAVLPRVAADAIREFADRGSRSDQENEWAVARIAETRSLAARLLGCGASEIALLGPTALGLNLVANGLPWQPGDEVVFYLDDYPANVYPWLNLASRGVKPVLLRPPHPGVITWELVEQALTERTRLVALASCHFASGFRIDVDRIGRELGKRGVLFSLDGIQTLGAFPVSVEHVDFVSADSHKWMLGPVGAGLFYVKASRQELLKPTLLGSWNVVSPQFIAQEEIRFHDGARRYEPGTFSVPGIVGMGASLKFLLDLGVESIGRRILELRRELLDRVRPLGFRHYIEEWDGSTAADDSQRSGIVALVHDTRDLRAASKALASQGITASLRQNREGRLLLRFSPHFYNTVEEIDRVAGALSIN
jgi:selenocysteine lyase/cysteine desulfurase